MSLNLGWSDIIGPWELEPPAPRVRRVECQLATCRYVHEPNRHAPYCCADCTRDGRRAARVLAIVRVDGEGSRGKKARITPDMARRICRAHYMLREDVTHIAARLCLPRWYIADVVAGRILGMATERARGVK